MTSWFNVLLARADKMLAESNVLNVPVDFVSRQIGLPRPLIFTGGLFLICVGFLLTNGVGLVYMLILTAFFAQSSVTPLVTLDNQNRPDRPPNWPKYLPTFIGITLIELYVTPFMTINVFQTYWAVRSIGLIWLTISLGFDHAIGRLYEFPSNECQSQEQVGTENGEFGKPIKVANQPRKFDSRGENERA